MYLKVNVSFYLTDETVRIFELRDARPVPDPVYAYPESLRGTPLIIDNGEKIVLLHYILQSTPKIYITDWYFITSVESS